MQIRHFPTLFCVTVLLIGCYPLLRAADAPSAVPAALQTEFVYEAIVELGPYVDVGATPGGHRGFIPIVGGTFRGPKVGGVILPGGADWQKGRVDGATEVDALYSMKCDDGTVIIVHNQGVIAEQGKYLRTAAHFEVAEGPHVWLTRAQFVGAIAEGPRPGTVAIRIFRVL